MEKNYTRSGSSQGQGHYKVNVIHVLIFLFIPPLILTMTLKYLKGIMQGHGHLETKVNTRYFQGQGHC